MTKRSISHRPQLDDRELATILAALRHWQREVHIINRVFLGPRPSDEFKVLTKDEIDSLCSRLNLGRLGLQ